MQNPVITFGEFYLDLAAQRLRRGADDIRLRQKTWEVLTYLARRPGVAVSNRELLDVLWADVAVTPGVLNNIIWELRKAFGGKEASAPFLETIPKRGFRFTPNAALSSPSSPEVVPRPPQTTSARPIGRDYEVSQLLAAWQQSLEGQRQIVFVSGMPGIGKTTVVTAALGEIRELRHDDVSIAKGQCLRVQGEAEPYLPILEGFEQLIAKVGESAFADLARRYAPSWLVQIPWLVEADELAELRRTLAASGTRRVLHDAVRLCERLSEQTPIVFVIEDMQWADATTLDFVTGLAERTTNARIMLIGTFRPIEVTLTGHPVGGLARSLCERGRGRLLPLEAWSLQPIQEYLEQRLPTQRITRAFAQRIEALTHGNPLFVRETADYLLERDRLNAKEGTGGIATDSSFQHPSLPSSLNELLDTWLAKQPATVVDVLQAASLIEGPFTVQEVAFAVGQREGDVDRILAALAHDSRLIDAVGIGRWPDGTVTSAYTYSHALYRRAVSAGLAALRQRDFHRAIATRLESAFHREPRKVAARLASHFEGAGDEGKRADFLEIAAASAVARYAYVEGAAYTKRAIESLQRLPPTPPIKRRQAERWIDYSNCLPFAKGIGNLEGRQGFESALQIAREVGETRLSFRAQLGLAFNYFFAGNPETTRELSLELVEIAKANNPRLLPVAYFYVAISESALGEFDASLERMRSAFDMEAEPGIPAVFNLKLAIEYSWTNCLALLGRVSELGPKTARLNQATSHARTRYERLETCVHIAAAFAWTRQWDQALVPSGEAVALADELQCAPYQTLTRILRARADPMSTAKQRAADIAELLLEREQAYDRWLNTCFYGWLAEAYLECGDLELALETSEVSLSREERLFRSENWRIRGTILDGLGRHVEAEECYRTAMQVSDQQNAQCFHLRAAVALARRLKQTAREKEGRKVLKQAIDRCREAQGSIDLMEAQAELRGTTGVRG